MLAGPEPCFKSPGLRLPVFSSHWWISIGPIDVIRLWTIFWRLMQRYVTMSSNKSLRKQLFVDPKVQGALVWRSILYWCVCLATVTLMLLCWRILTGPARLFYYHFDDMWFYYGPALIASLVMLPLVVIDIVRLSNRFTGPMLRLRRSMRALTRGEHVAPIRFRDNDFWQEFAEEFNAVAALVQGRTNDPTETLVAEDGAAETQPTPSGEVESAAQPEPATDQHVSTATLDVAEDRVPVETAGSGTS